MNLSMCWEVSSIFEIQQIIIMLQPIERAINLINPTGCYQKLMVAYLFFIAAFVNYMLMGPTFIFMNPLFSCSFSGELLDQSQACPRISQCRIAYDFTIVSQLGLYCDKQIERNLIQSISSIGSIVGLIVISFISDVKGKKTGIILALLIGILGTVLTLIGGYTASVWVLVISQFFCGFCCYSMIITAYTLPTEFTTQAFREKTIVIINYAWSLTVMLLGLLFYLQVQWSNFLVLFVMIPMIGVAMISFFFLVDGPNFLYRNKRQKECLQTLKTVALYNNKMKQYEEVQLSFKYQTCQEQKQQISTTEGLKKVWMDPYYRKTIIILIIAEIGSNLYYMSTNYALDQIGFDYGANMVGTGTIQFLAFVFLQFKINSLPRRKTILWLYIIMAALGMLFFIGPIVQNTVVSFIIIGVTRYFSTISYALIVMILTQWFPMEVQGSCAGVIESLAQIGMLAGPVVITGCIDLQIYPMLALSFIVLVTVVIPMYVLEERRQKKEELLISNSEVETTAN